MERLVSELVAAILLAVAAPHCPAAYGGSSDEQSTPQSKPPSRKTLLNWPGRTHDDQEEPDEPKRLDPDRPHLPESSTAVGKGRIVLESGYTFTKKGSAFTQSYPEALLRVGLFTDWSEFRLGQSLLSSERTKAGVRRRAQGAQDLYLGIKLALVAQRGPLPEIALIPQTTVPTGSRSIAAGKVLPGLNVDGAWEVNKRVSIELLIGTNEVQDDAHRSHVELASGLTGVFSLTPNLETFVEWDAFSPVTSAADAGPRHYTVGGCLLHHQGCRGRHSSRSWAQPARERFPGRSGVRRPVLNPPTATPSSSRRDSCVFVQDYAI